MLRSIRIINYGKIAKELCVRFDAVESLNAKRHHISDTGILRVSNLYSVGSGGKSTILSALDLISRAVNGGDTHMINYGVNAFNPDKPACIEVEFDIDGQIYFYYIELDNTGAVIDEEFMKSNTVKEFVEWKSKSDDERANLDYNIQYLFRWCPGELDTIEFDEEWFSQHERDFILKNSENGKKNPATYGCAFANYTKWDKACTGFEPVRKFFDKLVIISETESKNVNWNSSGFLTFFYHFISDYCGYKIRGANDMDADIKVGEDNSVSILHHVYDYSDVYHVKEVGTYLVPYEKMSRGFKFLVNVAWTMYNLLTKQTDDDLSDGIVLLIDNIDGVLNPGEYALLMDRVTYPSESSHDDVYFFKHNVQLIGTAKTIPPLVLRTDEVHFIEVSADKSDSYTLNDYALEEYYKCEELTGIVTFDIILSFINRRFGAVSRVCDVIYT